MIKRIRWQTIRNNFQEEWDSPSFNPTTANWNDFIDRQNETEYYKQHRSHMCRGHLPPVREEPEEVETIPLYEIEVKSFVGGPVKGFQRKAA
ncbi:hypothetical protein [Planctomicrobium sp. SH527]|uniref:hypothetical protein n=1 Tax=Planctomicrobium sp. SH527 TaxID=3448123 RepID=UPI003F5CA43F